MNAWNSYKVLIRLDLTAKKKSPLATLEKKQKIGIPLLIK